MTHDRTVPVQRVRPGDHAFTAYDSETARWAVLGTFVRQGLIQGEKVLVLLAPETGSGHTDLGRGPAGAEALNRIDARTPAAEQAWRSGQLSFGSMRGLIRPHREFTPERQWQRLTEETDLAVRQGYPAVRAYIDMGWTADLGTDLGTVLERERNAGHLFAGRPYSEVCAYDERVFRTRLLDAMAEAHPRNLLDGPGGLRAAHGERSVRLAGEADAVTAEAFSHALRTALGRVARTARPHLTADLTPLYFLGSGCATDLLRMCAAARSDRVRTTVLCTAFQARMLERLGSRSLRSPDLTVEEGRGC